jgi:vesicle coat complex subunit
VAKLYDSDPELVENRGFLDDLRGLLSDSNPLVVANAVAALVEIDEVSSTPVFTINRSILGKLVTALEESSEWAQCYILNSLARYTPRDGREAKTIVDKVIPVLQHANSAVVMGAIRVMMVYLDHIDNKEYAKTLVQKLRPPLGTLLL